MRDRTMPRPFNQDFDTVSGPLGAGLVTIFGITFYALDSAGNIDYTAAISVNADSQLEFDFATSGPHVVGYKSADGTNFDPYDPNNPGDVSFSVFSPVDFEAAGYRDGNRLWSGVATGPFQADVHTYSGDIDEVRLSFSG